MQGFSDYSNYAFGGKNLPGAKVSAEDYYNNFSMDEISTISNR